MKKLFSILISLYFGFCTPSKLAAQTFNEDWHEPQGVVNAMEKVGNTLYLGGSFNYLGISRQGGAVVDTMGNLNLNFPSLADAIIRKVVDDGAGGWVIAGSFNQLVAQNPSNLARFSPSGSLSPMNLSANGTVNSIARSGDTLFVVGSFSIIAGAPRSGYAEINLSNGTVYPINPFISGYTLVNTVKVTPEYVFVGGNFSQVGSLARNNLFVINRANGTIHPFNPPTIGGVSQIEVVGNKVFVIGGFTSIQSQVRLYASAFDFTTGALLPWAPNPNITPGSILYHQGKVYLGGSFTEVGGQTRMGFAVVDTFAGIPFNGTPGVSNNGNFFTVNTIKIANDHLFLGGFFEQAAGQTRRSLARFRLQDFSLTSNEWNPNGSLNDIGFHQDKMYLAGNFNSVCGQIRKNLAAINLSDGSPLPWGPRASGEVKCIKANSSILWVGGMFDTIDQNVTLKVAAFNLNNGQLVPSLAPQIWGISLESIEPYGTSVFLGGIFSQVNGQSRNNLALWSPQSQLVDPFSASFATGNVNAIKLVNNVMYVGGFFNTVNSNPRSNLAALDIFNASLLPWNPIANGRVTTLEVFDTILFAGGEFTFTGGQSRNKLTAISTQSGLTLPWNASINTSTSKVNHLQIFNSELYVGGQFNIIGNQIRRSIAVLDPYTAQANTIDFQLTQGNIETFILDNSGIILGGASIRRSNRALNTLAPFVNTVASIQLDEKNGSASLQFFPNPARGTVYIKHIEPIEFRVFDVLGKMIYTGRSSQDSDYQRLEVSGLSSGMYLIQINDTKSGMSRTGRLVME
jgi:hypothetical protein